MMKSIAVMACLTSLIGSSFAADKLPPGAAVYDEFPASDRSCLVEAYKLKLKQQALAVEQAKKQITRAVGAEAKKTATEKLSAEQSSLAELKEKNDPPFVGVCIDWWGQGGTRLQPEDLNRPPPWKPGNVGMSSCKFEIVRVIDPKTVHARRKVIGDWQAVTLKGWDATKWADGDKVSLPTAVWVSGTRSNGIATTIVVEPFDWDRYRKSLQKAD